jgi:hypothetical protein
MAAIWDWSKDLCDYIDYNIHWADDTEAALTEVSARLARPKP